MGKIDRRCVSLHRSLTPILPVALALCMLLSGGCGKTDTSERVPVSRPGAPKEIATKLGIEMVLIPAGEFIMGDDGGEDDEKPAHRVRVGAFYVDKYEVTQKAYEQLMGRNPAKSKGPDKPVEQVSWLGAVKYCNMRSLREGLTPCYDPQTLRCDFNADGYRLPTEAEWEYACRAGTAAKYSFGHDPRKLAKHAWFKGNANKSPHPVGQKAPNPWGLRDMHGNVWEWCHDFYSEDYKGSGTQDPRGPTAGEERVLRGGSWGSGAESCRSSARYSEAPGFADVCFGYDAYGFRCVRKASTNNPHPPKTGTNPPGKTGFVYDPIYLQHKTSAGHPETPQRLVAIANGLKQAGLVSQLTRVAPRAADLKWITAIHSPQYVERVRKSCEVGAVYLDTRDVPVSAESYDVALTAAGGVLAAVDAIMAGRIRNAFCAIRPPGHHALRDKAMGFCVFNNVAIAARYIQKKHGLSKVLIVDWDVHHGNATQDAFYDDASVMYFGIHQYPFYPGTGGESEKGAGKGVGSTVNAPLPAGSGDEEYKKAFNQTLKPAALAFKPDFVLISAGFDAHEDDPLGGMKVTANGFADLTRIVKDIAERCSQGRIVSMLEGGYSLESLADSVEAHIRVLVE